MNKSKTNALLAPRLWMWAAPAVITIACLALYFRFTQSNPPSVFQDVSLQQWSDEAVQASAPIKAYAFPLKPQANLPSGFSPDLALRTQLPVLKAAADRGNANAACVLARAADLCGPNRYNLTLDEYPPHYLANLSDKNIEKFAQKLEFREKRMSALCSDIDPNDVGDANQRLLQSALAGNPRSMLKFALSPAEADKANKDKNKNKKPSKNNFSVAYRNYAESMLNAAAKAGDLEAIANVARAYAGGRIDSEIGSLRIQQDRVKSIAATRALALISQELEKQEMPSFYDTQGNKELEDGIRTVMGHMRPAERKRLAQLELAYFKAYQAAPKGDRFDRDPLDDLPEQACNDASLISAR